MSDGPIPVAHVAVGDELLAGEHVNGNGAFLGRTLLAHGYEVVAHEVVGDDVAAIAAAIRAAAGRAAAVVLCGGLGPTQDDLTRDGLAAALGVGLVRDAGLEEGLRERFAARAAAEGRTVPAMNFRQADLPLGGQPIPNPVGTAPGIVVELDGVPVYALPGVPRELEAMVTETVLPDLAGRFPQRPAVVRRTLRTVGMWESAVAEALAPEVRRAGGTPRIAFLASGGETRVVVTGSGPDQAAAEALVDGTLDAARSALGDAVYEGPTLEDEVVRLLRGVGATVACAESLSAGLLAARIANVPGASDVLRGGIVAYATELKTSVLGVPRAEIADHGVVSARTAEAMARGAAERCGADYAVALTGVAGPGAQDGVPPGTVYGAVLGPSGAVSRLLQLPGDRAVVRMLAVTQALALLRGVLVRDAGATRVPARGSEARA